MVVSATVAPPTVLAEKESVAQRKGHYEVVERAYRKEVNADVERFYDTWAPTYENAVCGEGYRGPESLTPYLVKYLGKDDSICDLGAGTGLIGILMRKLGFSNLTAYDASERMLDIAKSRDIYDEYVHALLEPGKPAAAGPFDAVVGSGIISPRHLNPSHFPAIADLLRPEGKLILSVNERWMNGHEPELDWCYDMRTELSKMEKKGIFKTVEIPTIPEIYRAIIILEKL